MYKIISHKYIRGWEYNIIQIAENKFCIIKTNRKEKRGKYGEIIKEGLSDGTNPEECFNVLGKAEKRLEEWK